MVGLALICCSEMTVWPVWLSTSPRISVPAADAEVEILPRSIRAIRGLMTASYSVTEPTGQLSIVMSAGQEQSLLSYSGDTP